MTTIPPEQMARVLVEGEYNRTQIIDAMRKRYPDADVEQIVGVALERQQRVDRDLERLAEQDAARARRAEHDLSRSTHHE